MTLPFWTRKLWVILLVAPLRVASAGVLLDFDASATAPGRPGAWLNRAASGSNLTNTAPMRVETVQGRTAVVFDGRQRLVSDFSLPAGFEKGQPFTIEAWALSPGVGKSGTVVALARIGGGSGTEFNLSSGLTAGAFRSGFKATTPFGTVPGSNQWHHLAWTYAGGTEGALRVYVDGELDTDRKMHLGLTPQLFVYVGASAETNNLGPRRGFSGAVAQVRLRDRALTQEELRQSAGLLSAFAPSPRDGATTDSLATPLRWQRGTPEATSFLVRFATNREALEREDQNASIRTTNTETRPLPTEIGTTWFWRVDQLDKTGGIIATGVVWSFTADPGLASEPQPHNHDANVVTGAAQLAWRSGKYATRQRIFFGASAEAVQRSKNPTVELNAGATTWSIPAGLVSGTRYYWRVDSDNGAHPSSLGPIWNFRTQDAPLMNDVTFFVSSDTHYGRENNGAINRLVIDEMNALPGTPLPVSIGGGFVRTPQGVVLNGDLLDEGFNKETAAEEWTEFCRDYGLTGADGRLCFPVYEGFGNHDGGPTKSFVRAGIKERNLRRAGLKMISENGLHYSWDWDPLHLVQLNLFGGSGPSDVKNVNGIEHDPERSLEFLKKDLAENVGDSGRPVIVFQHFSWLGGMADWWQPEAKERFYEAVKPYNIVCLINGHSHGAELLPWHDLLTIHDGSTARGESDTGDFMVVRVMRTELIVVQRKLGEWGISVRKSLAAPVASSLSH